MELDTFVFSKRTGFVETEMRRVFRRAVPLRTVVVYCYDPRAINIPRAVAKAMPGEVYPGIIVCDQQGNKVSSTTTIFKAFHDEQGVDISALYDRGNIAIADYESSLKKDIRLVRESKGTPKNVNIYGFLFNIDTEALTLIAQDRATSR